MMPEWVQSPWTTTRNERQCLFSIKLPESVEWIVIFCCCLMVELVRRTFFQRLWILKMVEMAVTCHAERTGKHGRASVGWSERIHWIYDLILICHEIKFRNSIDAYYWIFNLFINLSPIGIVFSGTPSAPPRSTHSMHIYIQFNIAWNVIFRMILFISVFIHVFPAKNH